MWKLIPDFSGGFTLVRDYGGEFTGGIVGALIMAFFIGAPITLFILAPESFTLALACFGICLILLFLKTTLLSFLVPLSLPVFSYGLASTCNALLANSDGELQIFMYLIVGFILLLANALFYTAVGGEVLGGFSLVCSVVMWFSCCNSTMGGDGTWNFYLMKFLWIASAVCCVVALGQMLFAFFKGKGKSYVEDTISMAAGAVMGLVLLGLASFLGRFIHGWLSALICLVVIGLLYVLVTALLSSMLPGPFSVYTGIVIVLLCAGIAWMLRGCAFNVPDLILPEMLQMISNSWLGSVFAGMASSLPAYSSDLLSFLLTGLLDLIAHFFDASNDIFITCSEVLTMNISMALLAMAALRGYCIRNKIQSFVESWNKA